jgi:hypothetical protein
MLRLGLLPLSLISLAAGCAVVEHDVALLEKNLGDGGLTLDLADSPDATQQSDAAKAGDLSTTPGCDVHQVRINELSTAGPGGATDEFVELYNPCPNTVTLYGAKLAYRAATSGGDNFTLYVFAQHGVPAHGTFVVANGNFPGTADCKPFQTGGGLAAAGGGVALKDGADAVIDSIGWGTAVNGYVEGHAVAAPSSGESLGRKTDGTDSNDNAADFELGTPTPGALN